MPDSTTSTLWKKSSTDGDLNNSLIWDSAYHKTGSSVPANAGMFGLTIIDWDKNFRNRIKSYSLSDLQIPFQYIETIPTWEKSANWNDSSDIMGRFEPMVAYASSSAQEISLNLIYVAEAEKRTRTTRTFWTSQDIEQHVRRLKALTFPMLDGEYSPPPKLVLNIGSIFINVPVVVKQVQITPEAPFNIRNLAPMCYKVQLSLRVSYPTWQGLGASTIYASKDNRVFAYRELK